jgi:hypothetical protein
LFAVATSVLILSCRSASNVPQLIESAGARLSALSRAHALTDGIWLAVQFVAETGNFAGVKRRVGAAAWGGTAKGLGDEVSKLGSQPISELAIDVRGPDLHQHVRASDRPAHLLALGHALADNRIYGGPNAGSSIGACCI